MFFVDNIKNTRDLKVSYKAVTKEDQLNVVSLLQALQAGGGIMGIVGFVVSYGYQYLQHKNCVANLPRLPALNLETFGQQVVESYERQASCPNPDVGSALVAATVVGLVATLVVSQLKNNKN